MEILEGSYGGRHGLDGMDTVDTLYANTRNNPIEDIESHLPMRVLRYELREDMAAPGEWRGGVGSVREFAYLTDGGFSRSKATATNTSPGALTAAPTARRARWCRRQHPASAIELPSKVPYRKTKSGDRLIAYGPSGGGYGSPLRPHARKPCSTTCSTASSRQALAREQYGVVIAGGAIDEAATKALPSYATQLGREFPMRAIVVIDRPGGQIAVADVRRAAAGAGRSERRGRLCRLQFR